MEQPQGGKNLKHLFVAIVVEAVAVAHVVVTLVRAVAGRLEDAAVNRLVEVDEELEQRRKEEREPPTK